MITPKYNIGHKFWVPRYSISSECEVCKKEGILHVNGFYFNCPKCGGSGRANSFNWHPKEYEIKTIVIRKEDVVKAFYLTIDVGDLFHSGNIFYEDKDILTHEECLSKCKEYMGEGET